MANLDADFSLPGPMMGMIPSWLLLKGDRASANSLSSAISSEFNIGAIPLGETPAARQ